MTEMFTTLTSSCIPLPLDNVRTEQIIPSRFLKSTADDDWGQFLFHDLRLTPDGTPDPALPINDNSYSGEILVAGRNFGAGSSREHAVWALAERGFRAIIATSFADIFKQNALNNGILPIVVSERFHAKLLDTIYADHVSKVDIDLDNQTVCNTVTGEKERFGINIYKKNCLMQGTSDIDFLLSKHRDITVWEENHKSPYKQSKHGQIEILDTTLRDGEQTSGVSFSPTEKLLMTQLILTHLNVPRIEIASSRVSEGEFTSARRICSWAQRHELLDKIEILGYIDGGKSVKWVLEAGGKVINLLAKGSEKHCRLQLKKTPEEHFSDIAKEVRRAHDSGLDVNLYLEDWSNGIMQSPQYVYKMMDSLKGLPIHRFMLPDTLGVMNPNQVYEYCKRMVTRYPDVHFDFHAHNDYDFATANSFAAGLVGIKGLHCTINGLGERAGNAPLASVVAMVHDMLHMTTDIDESQIYDVSHSVESFSGVIVPQNEPIIGENAFTQTAGIHADGDNKSELYFNELLPERFGRKRVYALGKLSGEASIKKNLVELGIKLGRQYIHKVTKQINALGDRKEIVTKEDLPNIVSDVVTHNSSSNKIKIVNYAISISKDLLPTATVKLDINGTPYEQTASGDGTFDAFCKAVGKIYKENLGRQFPRLLNYTVSIPPNSNTDAMVMTNTTWQFHDHTIKTRGLNPDQIEASIQATLKMLNIIEGISY